MCSIDNNNKCKNRHSTLGYQVSSQYPGLYHNEDATSDRSHSDSENPIYKVSMHSQTHSTKYLRISNHIAIYVWA